MSKRTIILDRCYIETAPKTQRGKINIGWFLLLYFCLLNNSSVLILR